MSVSLWSAFFLTALVYASVGFGGGSTYSALLVLGGVDYSVLPTISLACNIIVVAGGVWRFSRAGQLDVGRVAPFMAASIPAAWLGGAAPVSETAFVGLLGATLLLAGLQLLFVSDPSGDAATAGDRRVGWPLSLAIGGAIGLLSGIVGIGGGIFLAPALYLLRWGPPRRIAAACSLFILVNSISGLAGQLTKIDQAGLLAGAAAYWPLLVAVFVGGQVGSWLGATRIKPAHVRRLTALLILYVAVRLLWRFAGEALV